MLLWLLGVVKQCHPATHSCPLISLLAPPAPRSCPPGTAGAGALGDERDVSDEALNQLNPPPSAPH